MAQRLYHVQHLPDGGIAACAAFHADQLGAARALVADGAADALAIVLPPAGPDHTDWRRALARDLARDLARAHAPVRVNVVAGPEGPARDSLIAYLADAKAVTGHYLETHG